MDTCLSNWSIEEIEKMRALYLTETAIKIIARIMKRTPSSINKALTRFRIRPQKYKGFLDLGTPKELKKTYFYKGIRSEPPYISYLKQVMRLDLTDVNGVYYLNKKIITKNQLLYKANIDRLQKNLPVFYGD